MVEIVSKVIYNSDLDGESTADRLTSKFSALSLSRVFRESGCRKFR